MSSVVTQVNQTLFDIAVQESGTVEALFDLMKLNGLVDLSINPETELLLPAILNPQVVDYYKKKAKQYGLNPVTVVSAGMMNLAQSAIKYALRHDFTAENYSYCGKAISGTSETSASWRIKRIHVATDGTTTITTAVGVSWTDRYTVIYS